MTGTYLSPLVSCLTCREVKSSMGLFSHIRVSHTEEGRLSIAKAGKASIEKSHHTKQKDKAKFVRDSYYDSPNFCTVCLNPLDYAHRNTKFCGSSCAAKNSIVNRKKSGWIMSTESRKKQGQRSNYLPHSKITFYSCTNCNTVNLNKGKNSRKYCPKCYSILTSENMRRLANERYASGDMFGGNKTGSKCGYFISKFCGKVYLESSYEMLTAQILEENNIEWKRPGGIRYIDDHGVNRRYFPDFEIVNSKIYLDPKNDFLMTVDKRKINLVQQQNGVIIKILSKEMLNWDYIKTIL